MKNADYEKILPFENRNALNELCLAQLCLAQSLLNEIYKEIDHEKK
jgi:hypothetical protein